MNKFSIFKHNRLFDKFCNFYYKSICELKDIFKEFLKFNFEYSISNIYYKNIDTSNIINLVLEITTNNNYFIKFEFTINRYFDIDEFKYNIMAYSNKLSKYNINKLLFDYQLGLIDDYLNKDIIMISIKEIKNMN